MVDVVLLHGAWHQPAHFDDLIARLAEAGLSSVAPDLYGRSLDERKQLVEEIISAQSRPPLVLAHSFGGAAAGMVEGASQVLYLAAWILDAGESAGQLIEHEAERTGIAPTIVPMAPDADGNLRLDTEGARAAFYADCSDEVVERAVRLLRAEPPTIFAATPTQVTWRDVPSHYVVAEEDRALAASLSDTFAARCSSSETWATSHSAYLSQPERVVELIQGMVDAD